MEPLEPMRECRALICSYDSKPSCWQPAVDVYRDRSGWVCKFDLAGVGPDDLEIRASDGMLILSGVRRDRCAGEGMRGYSLEIAYSRFERTVQLPCGELDRASITSEFRDGMLLVTIIEAEGRS